MKDDLLKQAGVEYKKRELAEILDEEVLQKIYHFSGPFKKEMGRQITNTLWLLDLQYAEQL